MDGEYPGIGIRMHRNGEENKMVILIGGTSCAGKTLLAQKLLERYKIRSLQ